jgi:hypothetical protein
VFGFSRTGESVAFLRLGEGRFQRAHLTNWDPPRAVANWPASEQCPRPTTTGRIEVPTPAEVDAATARVELFLAQNEPARAGRKVADSFYRGVGWGLGRALANAIVGLFRR